MRSQYCSFGRCISSSCTCSEWGSEQLASGMQTGLKTLTAFISVHLQCCSLGNVHKLVVYSLSTMDVADAICTMPSRSLLLCHTILKTLYLTTQTCICKIRQNIQNKQHDILWSASPLFAGAPVRSNMLNMLESASAEFLSYRVAPAWPTVCHPHGRLPTPWPIQRVTGSMSRLKSKVFGS